MWEAARLYKQGIARQIIVSGGNFVEQAGGLGTSEADAMRQFLVDLGVPTEAIVSEGASLNTIENIRNVGRLIGEGRVALVTSGYHMPRALRLARSAKLSVGAFPTDWRVPPEIRPPWENWMPSAAAMYWSNVSLREYVALLFDRRG
jgi:uncharacterized SAM-binding protein YcdF (DUF218 family)